MNVMDRLLREGIEVFPVGENKHIRDDTPHRYRLVMLSGKFWYRTGDWPSLLLTIAGGRQVTTARRYWRAEPVLTGITGWVVQRYYRGEFLIAPGCSVIPQDFRSQQEAQRAADQLNRQDDLTLARYRDVR